MREETGHQLSAVGVHERSLVHAVVARFVMLQAEVGGVIRQREEEIVVAVVPRPEEGAGLRDEGAVLRLELGTDRESRLAVGRDVEAVWGSAVGQGDDAKILAREERRVHEGRQRHRRESETVGRRPGRALQRRGPFPPLGQPDRRGEEDLVGLAFFGVEEDRIPGNEREIRGGGGARRELSGFGGREVIDVRLDRVGAGRDDELDAVHVEGVAFPRDGLPGCREPETREIGDRPGGSVFAGDPLRVEESQCSGRGRNHQLRVEDLARRFARVHLEDDGPILGGLDRRGARRRGERQGENETQTQRHFESSPARA